MSISTTCTLSIVACCCKALISLSNYYNLSSFPFQYTECDMYLWRKFKTNHVSLFGYLNPEMNILYKMIKVKIYNIKILSSILAGKKTMIKMRFVHGICHTRLTPPHLLPVKSGTGLQVVDL